MKIEFQVNNNLFWKFSRVFLFSIIVFSFIFSGGCSCVRKKPKPVQPSSGLVKVVASSTASVATSTVSVKKPGFPSSGDGDFYEKKAISELEQSVKMLKSSNLGGALRMVERVQQNFPRDNYLNMQSWYIKAMIFHRQRDMKKRKEAMDSMLKCIESLQKDPKYLSSVQDGKEGADLIRMSIEKKGKRFENK
ncbi:MAG: hypothetical protein HQM10_16020 [Candidatus Riflebacteria bacterium]|nr:hypothetical protein [Candidatus Riflebacteria bacterium]